MFRITFLSVILCLVIASFFITAQPARGEERGKTIALVIVSGHGGYTPSELSKASSFRRYLETIDVPRTNIRYLTSASDPLADGNATVANVEAAFLWLIANSVGTDNVVIHISDHVWWVDNNVTFKMDDGTIRAERIDGWLDKINCTGLDVILNGPHSGLAGTDVSGDDRNVLCSMKVYQDYVPDRFNITRSLLDPESDKDHDGEITYLEAFEMERIRIAGTGQEPVRY